jgi:hypothetical protein
MIGNFQTSKSLNVREREYRCLCSYYVINTYASLMNLKKMERYLRVNLLGPRPSSYKKIIYRAAVSQRLGNTALECLGRHGTLKSRALWSIRDSKGLISSSSFLRLLPHLPVTSIPHFIFPSTTCRRRQFLRNMRPIQLAFRLLISCTNFPPRTVIISLHVLL